MQDPGPLPKEQICRDEKFGGLFLCSLTLLNGTPAACGAPPQALCPSLAEQALSISEIIVPPEGHEMIEGGDVRPLLSSSHHPI